MSHCINIVEGDLQYDCVELGAGTGKLTKKLLNELPEVGEKDM